MTAPPIAIPAPAELAPLARVVGDTAALAIIESWGGTRLYVPRAATNGDLMRRIGPDALGRLAAAYGGESIKVPLAKRWRARLYRARGLSYAEIAIALGCNQSSVHRYLSEGVASPQLKLL